jgi:catechol 2,3-dioxygenase
VTRDIAHLSAVELYSAVPHQTVRFFHDLMGMEVVDRRGKAVYLHACDDYERFTVKVTAHESSGIGRTWLRAASADALARRVAAIEAAGLGVGWSEDEPHYGPVYHFADPDGHPYGIYWDTYRYEPTPDLRPSLKNQASRFPARGANVRRLDHVNFLAAEIAPQDTFLADLLVARKSEQIISDDGSPAASTPRCRKPSSRRERPRRTDDPDRRADQVVP